MLNIVTQFNTIGIKMPFHGQVSVSFHPKLNDKVFSYSTAVWILSILWPLCNYVPADKRLDLHYINDNDKPLPTAKKFDSHQATECF